jgi:hypothetical protein
VRRDEVSATDDVVKPYSQRKMYVFLQPEAVVNAYLAYRP